ncbi:hypothetical protein BGZ47_000477, partial [Haplosporangium gracile]
RNFVSEPSIIQFLAERVQLDSAFKRHLLAIIKQSKSDVQAAQAAANAMTILIRAGVRFNGMDLQDVRIPGADMSGGEFDSVADLTGVNFTKCWLRKADFSGARMHEVQFGEYPYLKSSYGVYSCAFSPDGKTFTMGTGNGDIHIYDTSSWIRTQTLLGHEDKVGSLAFPPRNSLQLLSGSKDTTARLWNLGIGPAKFTFEGHTEEVEFVAFSLSGLRIITTGQWDSIKVWDALAGDLVFAWADDVNYFPFAYSPDRDQIDGQRIVSGHGNGMMQLWETASDKPRPAWEGHKGGIYSVVFSPDGQRIASCGYDKAVKLWDAQTRTIISVFIKHSDCVHSVAFSSNGAQLASGGEDFTVRIWDAKSNGSSLGALETPNGVLSVAYSPKGQSLITGSWSDVRKYHADTGEPELVLSVGRRYVERIAYSADGLRFATCLNMAVVEIWNAETGVVEFKLEGHTKATTSVTFSPLGGWIATGSADKTIRLWDAVTGIFVRVLAGHTEGVADVSFSPCEKWIASGGCEGDGSIRIWDVGTGQSRVLVRMQERISKLVVYSPSNRQIASRSELPFGSLRNWSLQDPVKEDGISIWDAQTGELQHTLKTIEDVNCFAFSSCGHWIVAGYSSSLYGHSVYVFHSGKNNTPQEWRRLSVVRGFLGEVKSVAWRHKHGTLEFVTGCWDGSTRVWRVITYAYALDASDVSSASVEQVWSTGLTILSVVGAVFLDALDLGLTNRELLKQQAGASDPFFFNCDSNDAGYDPEDSDDMDDSDNSDE